MGSCIRTVACGCHALGKFTSDVRDAIGTAAQRTGCIVGCRENLEPSADRKEALPGLLYVVG